MATWTDCAAWFRAARCGRLPQPERRRWIRMKLKSLAALLLVPPWRVGCLEPGQPTMVNSAAMTPRSAAPIMFKMGSPEYGACLKDRDVQRTTPTRAPTGAAHPAIHANHPEHPSPPGRPSMNEDVFTPAAGFLKTVGHTSQREDRKCVARRGSGRPSKAMKNCRPDGF